MTYPLRKPPSTHQITAPGPRIEQTRRRSAKLGAEGLIDRITLSRAGRTRVCFAGYGVQVGRSGRSCAVSGRLRVSHMLTHEMG